MRSHGQIAAVLIAFGSIASTAGAQAIYRCGNSYSQQPCAAGSVVEADDPRSASQREQAAQVARKDARLANEMERDRLKQEAKAPAYKPPLQDTVPPKPTKVASAPIKAKKPPYFTAVSPKKPGDDTKKKGSADKS